MFLRRTPVLASEQAGPRAGGQHGGHDHVPLPHAGDLEAKGKHACQQGGHDVQAAHALRHQQREEHGRQRIIEAQRADDGSLYHWVRTVLALRERHAALQADAAFNVVAAPEHGRLFAYARTTGDGSERLVIALNPGLETESFALPDTATSHGTPTMELSRGNVAADGTTVTLGPQSFVVFSF